ncbi:AraC family transcriptional regulator [Murimonas intestini]|uniref:AraC family transcriptional regulator n=1 Tax=Murimonas intestini TaxID=1337051 RepID=UPI0011DDD533|nr:AraC family transcriptional regulator [Murimonas intestini]
MKELEIMKDDSEIVHYDRSGVPLYIRNARLSSYPNMRALCHWHEDLEFIRVFSGKMNYYVNGKSILLNENDCLMVNVRQMHYGYASDKTDCDFACILFHPNLFTGNKSLYQDYILPILNNQNLEYLHFTPDETGFPDVLQLLDRIISLKEQSVPGYEMEVIGIMHAFWNRILQHPEIIPPASSDKDRSDLAIQKNMVSYIYQHFSEKISLTDIAAAGNICRNKCCVIFRHYLQQSPIEFLNSYRLKVSCGLLKETADSITRIALSCGFNHLSYYSKLFLQNYGCTPSEYRCLYTAPGD